MRSAQISLILLFALSCLTAQAQDQPRVYVGVAADAHFTWEVKEHWFQEQTPGFGWEAELQAMINLSPSLTVTTSIGAVKDQSNLSVPQPGGEINDTEEFAWAAVSVGGLYRVKNKTSVSWLFGGDFSARHLLESTRERQVRTTGGRVTWSEHLITKDEFNAWNYFLSPRLGVEFSSVKNSRVQLFLEYHVGLRYLVEANDNYCNCTTCDCLPQRLHFLQSVGVSTAWLWPWPSRGQ